MSLPEEDGWVLVGKDGRTHSLPHGMIFIGREECEITLQAVSADKRHAVVYYSSEDKHFLIKDLNSLTGTYVNGVRIPEQTYVRLKHLDCIRFGYGPDVFYLERSYPNEPIVNEKACTKNRNTCHNQKHPNDADKPKPNSVPISDVQKTQEQPSLNRTDVPPDTLSLNLSANNENERNWPERENLSDSPDYSHRSESSSCSAPANSSTAFGHDHDASSTHSSPAAMAFTVAFESEVTTPRKKPAMRDSARKFSFSKPEVESSVQRNSKSDSSSQKIPIANVTSADVHKLRSNTFVEESKNSQSVPQVQDAACFLIEKMLNTNVGVKNENMSVRKNGPKEICQNDADDGRSEAGTYTVETENNDGDVEDARKRIDEVFGVNQPSSILPPSHPANTNFTSTKQIPCLNGHIKFPPNKSNCCARSRVPNDSENTLWNRTNKGVSRGRRLIPAPTETNPCSDRHQNETQWTKKHNEPPATPDKTRRTKLIPSPGRAKNLSSLRSPGPRTNNLSALPTEKNIPIEDDQSQCRSPDTASNESRSPRTTPQWQKVPWNLSGSDAELDQSKSENNSILSDTSTEPSSHSSHSGKIKPDRGPQMRLNRAFALRRARLEADSTKQGKKDAKTSPSQKAMKKSGKLSASTTALRDDTSGNKTNFRLAPAVVKPLSTKPPVRGIDSRSVQYKRKPELKGGHRRIESDPGKGIPVWRAESRPSTAGALGPFPCPLSKPIQKSPAYPPESNGLQSFHRSMSCSIMNDTEVPLPILPCSFVRSFEQSVLSGSQIVTGPIADEYQSRKHPNKELTALDSLVISAIHQLSSKLWTNSKALLEKERKKCPKESDCWLMIEEVLPSMPVSGTPEDGDLTKDLSNILKNLKRVEQGLEVLSCVLESDVVQESNMLEKKAPLPQNFFIVDM